MLEITKLVNLDQIISTDKYLRFATNQIDFTYHFRDFLYRKGKKRDTAIDRLIFHPRSLYGKNLVIGHSDWSLNKFQGLPFFILGVRKIFGTNIFPYKNFLNPLPIGITNDCKDSDVHPILGNEKHFISANDVAAPAKFDGSIYINFTPSTYPLERNQVLEIVQMTPKVTFKKVEMTNEGRVEYLRDLRTHSLVPCPRGNGIDTHRLWETLYMGGTPVLKRNPITDELTKELPVIYINNWEELVDLKLMEEKWNQLRNKKWKYDSLRMDYWISKMKDQGK